MSRNRKQKLTSGPAGKGQSIYYPLSTDANPLNGVTVQGPDSVGAVPLTLTLPSSVVVNGVVSSNATGTLSNALLVDANIAAGASITRTKLSTLSPSKAVVTDISGNDVASSTTAAEIGFLSGVTSAIQTQLNAKQTTTLTNGNVLIGNISNVAAAVPVTGDVLISNAGATSYNNTLPITKGGTGQITKAPAFDALQPMTTAGDIIVGGTAGTGTRLGIGSLNQVLTVAGGIPVWQAASGGTKQVVIGTPVTTNQSVTSATYVAFPTTMNLTFTATTSAKYRIYAATSASNSTGPGPQNFLKIVATAGAPTVIQNTVAYWLEPNAGAYTQSICPEVIVTLVSGNAYTFELQGRTSSGPLTVYNTTLAAEGNGTVLIAEQIE